ncbi:GNAT family N-acetyltransferase [Amycolatopsis nigrescens]|uniref:GNAT family N-acetyltransferase n=1 Tax=Amycolatopsis nigrescens TaxID=381445 RepID=UPI00037D9325|nr:GNAT family N-acetyltransferase [Amycolatopsis nigrescens]
MNVDVIDDGHATRLGTVDPLLPAPETLTERTGKLTAAAGESTGIGCVTRTEVAADSRDALWRALVEYRLDVRLAGPDPGAALGALLDRWEPELAAAAPPGDWDTAAVLVRPSRDSAGSAELLRHGFAPVRVTAVRPADRLAAAGPPATPGVTIRPAAHEDLGTAVRLQLELQRYDAQFGLITLRPGAEETIAAELTELLARAEPSLWIAELYGQPLGMLQVQLPAETTWIRDSVRAERVGYLSALHVAEAARSSGVGTALAAHAHQVFDEAGAEVVLLHHALANPRSTPFWYAQGYRPLWTYWYRRPAAR